MKKSNTSSAKKKQAVKRKTATTKQMKVLEGVDRQAFILKNKSRIKGFTGTTSSFLKDGSMGTVFLLESTDMYPKRAMNPQILHTPKSMEVFQREVNLQKKFFPYAPEIFGHGIDLDIEGYTVGWFIMELLEGTLDQELVKKLRKKELDSILLQVQALLDWIFNKKLVHGDLALFNLAFVTRRNVRALLFLDFDCSSDDKSTFRRFNPIDPMRLIDEFYCTSEGTEPMHKDNIKYLRTNIATYWGQKLSPVQKSPKTVEKEWTILYIEYCASQGIPWVPEPQREGQQASDILESRRSTRSMDISEGNKKYKR
jgi:hypothetical protein